jgi:hypothetical protein
MRDDTGVKNTGVKNNGRGSIDQGHISEKCKMMKRSRHNLIVAALMMDPSRVTYDIVSSLLILYCFISAILVARCRLACLLFKFIYMLSWGWDDY